MGLSMEFEKSQRVPGGDAVQIDRWTHLEHTLQQLKWDTGLCDTCYEERPKTCGKCDSHLTLLGVHWRTGLCDVCYDASVKTCSKCVAPLTLEQIQAPQPTPF